MKRTILAVAVLLIAGAVATLLGIGDSQARGEPLYLALEIEDQGRLIARPKLLGEEGTRLSMRLVEPAHPERSRLQLELFPERAGDGYEVGLKLSLPDLEKASGSLRLMHGEERVVTVANGARPISVRMLLMRVGSPEFETYMELYRRQHPPLS